jgi:hypothetical protein
MLVWLRAGCRWVEDRELLALGIEHGPQRWSRTRRGAPVGRKPEQLQAMRAALVTGPVGDDRTALPLKTPRTAPPPAFQHLRARATSLPTTLGCLASMVCF